MLLARYSFEELEALVLSAAAGGAALKRSVPKSIDEAGGCDNFFISLAGGMRKRGMSEEAIAAALHVENEKLDEPMDERRVNRIARSAAKYKPAPKEIPQTDAGNGERFAIRCRDEVRFCPQKGKWMAWDGKRWAEESDGRESYLAKTVARSIAEVEAAEVEDDTKARALRKWAHDSESQHHLDAMVRRAKSEPGIQIKWVQFDSDPYLLNLENGILNLKTGQLVEHDRNALCSKLAAVRFVPGARHPVLDAYLEHATGGDREFEGFLQRAFGYSLTGDVSAESFFMVIGPGGSGKTTLVEALKEMLGDYAGTIEAESFLKNKRNGAPRNDLAAICGMRMLGASEIEDGRQLSESTIKSLTGGEKISTRFLHKEFFSFLPMAKFWMAANEAPVVSDKDTGVWRRLVRLPFMNVAEKPDPTIKEILRKDERARSALLAWALQGCLDWQSRGRGKDGLAIPDVVSQATSDYRQGSNPLADFLDEQCELGPDHIAQVSALRAAYASWSKGQGQRVMTPQDFNSRLEAKGLRRDTRKVDGRAVKVWAGLSLVGVNQF